MTETIERRVEIVTNARGGGYGLSQAAARELARRKGMVLREEGGHLFVGDGYERVEQAVPRDDADLVAVVREMGRAADGGSCRLSVDTYRLVAEVNERDDGSEFVSGWVGEVRGG